MFKRYLFGIGAFLDCPIILFYLLTKRRFRMRPVDKVKPLILFCSLRVKCICKRRFAANVSRSLGLSSSGSNFLRSSIREVSLRTMV